MSLHVCSVPGCPTISDQPKCPPHRAAAERARGTRQQRGYDAAHDRERARWAPRVANGTVPCARCHRLIQPGQAWDLGHTDDRKAWTGPEHTTCNRSAGGRAAHRGGG